MRFLLHFHNILIYVLIGSAVITALLGYWIDTGVILAVVIANAFIGFIQEGKAEQAMDALRKMLAPRANVMRGGERVTVDGEQFVSPASHLCNSSEHRYPRHRNDSLLAPVPDRHRRHAMGGI